MKMDLIYCSKCKKKTKSTGAEHVKTVNNKWRLKAKCVVCKHEKSTFTRAPVEPSSSTESKPVDTDARLLEAKELHRRVIKKFPKRRIVTLGIDDLWAADLVIMDKYARENDGYKYMLNVIDTFSKYAWSEPLVRKSGADVVRAFQIIVKRAVGVGHKAPDLLHTDKGREFVNREFKHLLESYGTKMYHTENEEKSAIVERFNRTLNERMKVQFEVRNSFRWVDILQGLLKQYNESVHRTIRMRPVDVTKDCEADLNECVYTNTAMSLDGKKVNFKIGDRVRIVAKKDRFSNKYARNWNREIFTIANIVYTTPITYRIKDGTGEVILGSFYEKELQKTVF